MKIVDSVNYWAHSIFMVEKDQSLAELIAAFRHFNRVYTRFLGTLDEHYLGTDYSLAEGRVLYELATRSKPQSKEVAEALGLDRGYLSRILTKFEKSGLIERTAATHDKRAANLLLTSRGRGVVRALNTRADKQARTTFEGKSADEISSFWKALRVIEETVFGGEAEKACVLLRQHRPGDMGMLVHLEGAGYVREFGWDGTFEALAAQISADFLTHFDAARERCWVAEMDGRHVGHVLLVQHREQPDTARLRLLYVDPVCRGMGLGHQLVSECVQFAREVGYGKITLWTQNILTSAHRIYKKAGFHLVREEPHHSFGKDLVGQVWEMALT